MNKSDLVNHIAVTVGITKEQAKQAVDAMTGAIARSAALGEKVTIPGFGTFGSREVAAQMRRNPATGESLMSQATRKPTFKPGTDLKATVAGQVAVPASSGA